MSNKKMNVLFVAVDDLRPQMGCYGDEQMVTPHMDKLAGEGILFERAYCQQAICNPSRASLLTGCRPDTTGIYDLKTSVRSVMPDIVTLPQNFKNNGYETVSIGKIFHHNDDDPQGWSKPPIWSKGDWQGRGYLTDEAVEEMKINGEQNPTKLGVGPAFEAPDVPDNAYHDGKDADAAIEELQRLSELDKPFFLALGFHKPHLPFNAPKKYWDLYSEEQIELPENSSEPEGMTRYSLERNFGELRQYFGIPKEGPVPEELAKKLIHGYWACVSYMDAQFGRVLTKLDELKLKEDTIVILWGDHGWKLGEYASWCKHSNFEIDARAPLMIRVPGLKNAGKKTYALTEFVDIYPSLSELCGIDIPEHVEGTSFVPVLNDPERPWKKAAYSQYPRHEVMGYTMRTDDYRYTEWRVWTNGRIGKVLANELYDHREHSMETVNVVDSPQFAQVAEELAGMMEQELKDRM